MHHVRLALDSGLSWWLLVALAALAAGAVVLFYRRAAGGADRVSLAAMMALRVGLVLLVLVVIFRPSLGYETGHTERSVLLVLLDRSRSMSLSDAPGLPPRFDRARAALAGSGGALHELDGEFDVRLWAFDSAARRLGGEHELAAEQPAGEATDLAAALSGAASVLAGERLAGAVVLTDGQDNSGRDAAAEGRKLGFPVWPVAVGTRLSESEDFKDIAVNSVDAPRAAAVDNVCEVRACVDAVGFRGQVVPVSLFVADGQGEEEKCRAELTLDGRRGDQEVVLRFTPTKAGSFEARVAARFDPAERIAENNVQKFLLTVTTPRIRVLYLEGRVRTEYGFLRRNWELDPSVEVTGRVRVRAGLFIERSPSGASSNAASVFPETFDEARRFNVFVLGDIERASFSDAQIEALRRAVSEGAGLLCLAGQASFGAGGWANSRLAELLPADIASAETKEGAFAMQLTAAGSAHPIFNGCAEFFSAAEAARLPKLGFLNILGAPKPGAEVLAIHPELRDSAGRPRPVLVVQHYGKGRAAAFAAGPTWPWGELLRAQGRATPYAKFWGQMVRWLASEDVKRQVEKAALAAHIDKNIYQPGEKVRLWAEAYGEGGRLAPNARVEAAVSGPSGATGKVALAPVAESPGQFETSYAPPAPGPYTLKVSAAEAGQPLGDVEIQFQVGKPNLEFEKLDLNDRLLRRLADETRGRYYELAHLDELVAALAGEGRAARTGRQLRCYPDSFEKSAVVALLFIAAAAAEWLIRKRLQMA